MKINSAADLAAILDPEHKKREWWRKQVPYTCPSCYKPLHGNPMNPPYEDLLTGYKCCSCQKEHASDLLFIGPDDLHTAREHNWRLEDWLEEQQGCSWYRERFPSGVTRTQVYKRVESQDDCSPSHLLIGTIDANHTTALLSAIENVIRLTSW